MQNDPLPYDQDRTFSLTPNPFRSAPLPIPASAMEGFHVERPEWAEVRLTYDRFQEQAALDSARDYVARFLRDTQLFIDRSALTAAMQEELDAARSSP